MNKVAVSSLRILFVTGYYKPAYIYGGPVESTAALNEGLINSGADVTVYTTNANGKARLEAPLEVSTIVDHVNVWYFPLEYGGAYFYSPKLAEKIRTEVASFDIVVCATMWGHASHAILRACTDADIPYVVQLCGQLQPWALGHHRLKKQIYLWIFAKKFLNHASALHCTDASEKAAAEKLHLIPPKFIVPLGINSSEYRVLPERGLSRKRLGIANDAVVLLYVGRIVRIKRVDIAIDALTFVRTKGIDAHLVVVGPDEENLIHILQDKADRMNCGKYVHFTGMLKDENLMSAYHDADLFLMPSEIQENFGMSALEAMAAGLPILVSDGVPVGQWAEAAGAGRTVPCTVDAFCQTAWDMLASPDELRKMGKAGRELAFGEFDIGVVARKFLEQLHCILDSRKSIPKQGSAN